MVKFESEEQKTRAVFFSSLATSLGLSLLFLAGALLTNASMGGAAYTQVDMAAGSIFVFVIALIISLSLWPRVMDRLENKEKNCLSKPR
jgi:purine-cytosine permease-like protein